MLSLPLGILLLTSYASGHVLRQQLEGRCLAQTPNQSKHELLDHMHTTLTCCYDVTNKKIYAQNFTNPETGKFVFDVEGLDRWVYTREDKHLMLTQTPVDALRNSKIFLSNAELQNHKTYIVTNFCTPNEKKNNFFIEFMHTPDRWTLKQIELMYGWKVDRNDLNACLKRIGDDPVV